MVPVLRTRVALHLVSTATRDNATAVGPSPNAVVIGLRTALHPTLAPTSDTTSAALRHARLGVPVYTDVAVTDAAFALIAPRLGEVTRPLVRYCLTHAPTAPTVEQVAAALGVSRKTIAARLAAEGLPPASSLVGWSRVLLAARCLEDASRPVEHVALALGFDGGPALHHMLARYTGLRATEIRARGGLTAVLPLFVTAMNAGIHGQRRTALLSGLGAFLLTLGSALANDWDVVLTSVLMA